MSTSELTTKVKELKNLMALIEEAEEEAEKLKEQIKEYMGDREEVRAGEYKIIYKAVTTSRFDSGSFKKAMPDLYERFTRQTKTRRFTVA